jgi:glycosyltransferase involved in cell wall biosynthesis
MKIGMVLDREFPPDDRVKKEARSLINAGHEIFLLCLKFDNRKKIEEQNSIKIFRIKIPKLLFKKLSAIILIIPLYEWFWKYQIVRFVRRTGVQVLHIHDLPLGRAGIYIRKKYQIPFIIDMHEDYANWIKHTAHYNTKLGKIISRFSPWKVYEKYCLNEANNIIGVSDALVKKMINSYDLDSGKIICVPNEPDLNVFHQKRVGFNHDPRLDGKFNLIYVGGIDFLRGIQNVIPLLPDLKRAVPNIQLVIVGDGSYLTKLSKLAEKYSVEDLIYFAGWKTITEVAAYISQSQIGLYPQLSYPGIDETLPTKIYQYCALGKPVISSNHLLPRGFLQKYNCGFTIDFVKDSQLFLEIITKISNEPELANMLGSNGRAAIQAYHNWDNAVVPLLELYSKIQDNMV